MKQRSTAEILAAIDDKRQRSADFLPFASNHLDSPANRDSRNGLNQPDISCANDKSKTCH